MSRTTRQMLRTLAIDRRVRQRRLRDWRTIQQLTREREFERQQHMDMLARLIGSLESGTLSSSEVIEARAALLQGDPTSPQGALMLRETRHA